jgi:hypothetical protein
MMRKEDVYGSAKDLEFKAWKVKQIENKFDRLAQYFSMENDPFDSDQESNGFSHDEKYYEHSDLEYLALNFRYCVEEVASLIEESCSELTPDFEIRFFNKGYQTLEMHPFFYKDTTQALNIMSSGLVFLPDYYLARLPQTAETLDLRMLHHLTQGDHLDAKQLEKICLTLAKKHAFTALEKAFRAWDLRVPCDHAYTNAKAELVWQMIIESHAYSSAQLYAPLTKFIEHHKKSFEVILPMLRMNWSVPSPRLLIAMKNSGFGNIAKETGEHLLHKKKEYHENKYSDLESIGVEVSESFIRVSLEDDQLNEWKMAIAYYLAKDEMQIDLSKIDPPWPIDKKPWNSDGRYFMESDLNDLLKTRAKSEVGRKKQQELLSLFVDRYPSLLKRLIQKGLPESFMEMESVREERLYLDLGL